MQDISLLLAVCYNEMTKQIKMDSNILVPPMYLPMLDIVLLNCVVTESSAVWMEALAVE